MFDAEGEVLLRHGLKKYFADGARLPWETYELIETTVDGLEYLAKKHGSPIRLGLKTERKKRSGPPVIKGVIIYTPKITAVIPATVSPGLCQLRDQAIFLAHEDGAANLFDALLNEIKVTTVEKSEASQ